VSLGTLRLAAATAALVALVPGLVLPSARAGEGTADEPAGADETAPSPGDPWREVMTRAIEASRASAFQGKLAIIRFGDDGPTFAEVDIAQGVDGGMRVGRAETWMLGRSGESVFYRSGAGNLLNFGNVERLVFDLETLLDKYAVSRGETRDLRTGPAIVLGIREHQTDHDRERLYVDEATGLVVRRDTFASDGEPRRVVAFTELDVVELSVEAPEVEEAEQRGPFRTIGADGLRILDRTGWAVPDELPGGFGLRTGYATPEAGGGSLHLVYTDGLYTLSVYEQPGRLDTDALDGATEVSRADLHVWRWPGSEPERVVWSGDGLTFTAVSDAPVDTVLGAVAGLPADRPTGIRGRLTRGLGRVGAWLWPFD
jgi:hypothetical protein